MSSIHSQSSDLHSNDQEPPLHLHLQQQDHEQIPQGHYYNQKTPAIQEEEEENDQDVQEERKDGSNLTSHNISRNTQLRNNKSNRSSSNSTSSSNSNSNGNSNRSTITFEKQKVVPPRARAQSAQSVLSNISLRSLLLQNNLPQQQPQQPPAGNENSSTANYGNLNQQIQSPAMSSSMRRKGSTNVMFRRNSSENEIGLQLPFTDDKRMDLDPRQSLRRNFSRNSLLRHQSSNVETVEITDDNESNDDDHIGETDEITGNDADDGDDADEDDEQSQKKLTEKALRNLTFLKNRSLPKRSSDSSSQSSDRIGNVNENNDNEMFENITTQEGSMTHLQFGNKRVILDSSSFINDNSIGNGETNRSLHYQQQQQQQRQQQIFQPLRKPSLDVIQQPSSNLLNGRSKVTTKKNSKQISNPKKPLYVPAVLRDIAETNITIDDLMKPGSPQQTMLNNQQANANARNNHNTSSQVSVYSTTSSILETCKKKISSFLFPNSDFANPDLPYGALLESPVPPKRDHWLPDSKRASCHHCHKLFTFLERKHHCRHCGDIFCSQHLAHWLYLNSNAEFIIGGGGMGTLSKICDGCLEEYENLIKNPSWKDQRKSDQSSQDDNSNRASGHNHSHDQKTAGAVAMDKMNKDGDATEGNGDIIGSVVGSVPADWNWSSF